MKHSKKSGSRLGKKVAVARQPPQTVELLNALRVLSGADSVEFKLTVPDVDRASAVRELDIDVLDAEIRQVVFFDTPDLLLNRRGVVLRARRSQKGGDCVVKLRPVVPEDIPDKVRRSGSFSVEVDMMPGAFVCSGSLKGKVPNSVVKEVLAGERSVRDVFVSEQRALYKDFAPKNIDLDDLIPLGPINVGKVKFSPPALKNRSVVAEMWFYPDGSRVLELSTKCAPEDALRGLTEAREFLAARGIRTHGVQETKTHKALEYFSKLHSERRKGMRRAA